MLKWIVISLAVFSVLLLILLGLGKLLHDNEQRVTEIKVQKAGTGKERTEPKTRVILSKPEPQLSLTTTISQNLTCVSDNQCVLINAQFADLRCTVAINTIGAAIIAKTEQGNGLAGKCPEISGPATASCQANLCVISRLE